jgi:predicted kinase
MQSKATLHFFCGKIASGKTTQARRVAQEEHAILVSEDLWLSRMYPDDGFVQPDYIRRSTRLRAALGPHVIDLLRHGVSIVFDFAGNLPPDRAWVRALADVAQADHVLHYIKVSDAVCKERLRQRNKATPEGSQETTDEEFDAITSYFVPPAPDEGLNVVEYEDSEVSQS